MKKFSWWNKPITWGNYAVMCITSIVASIIYLAVIFGHIYGVFDAIGDWFKNLFKRKEYVFEDTIEMEEEMG